MKKHTIFLGLASFGMPLFAFAASGSGSCASAPFGPIAQYFCDVMTFMNGILVPFIFAIALLSFLYGMFKYFIQNGATEDGQKKGKQLIIYSVAGFVLMVSIWGIVNLIGMGLFGTNTQPPQLPSIPTSYSGSAGNTSSGYTPGAFQTPATMNGN